MSSAVNEAIFMLLLEEEFADSLHIFERESGVYFDLDTINNTIEDGKYDDALAYLSGFISVTDNEQSEAMFRKIRVQKLMDESGIRDTTTEKKLLVNTLGDLLDKNPRLRDKTLIPTFNTSDLKRAIIDMWNHQQGQPLMPPPAPRHTPSAAHRANRPRAAPQHEAAAKPSGSTSQVSSEKLPYLGAEAELDADPAQALCIILPQPTDTEDEAAQQSELHSSQPEGSSSTS